MIGKFPIKIQFVKEVTFRDRSGKLIKMYNAGDVIDATADTGSYFVTSIGGIYYDEACIVE
jgi:hypothetical protein